MARLPDGWLQAAGISAQRKNVRADAKADSRPMAPAEIGHLLQKGLAQQMKGNLWQAQEHYQAILAHEPNQPDALHLMALIALEAKHAGHAVQMLTRAVAGKPNDPTLRGSMADALIQNNDPAAAERHLRRGLKIAPDNPELLCKLAHARAMLGGEDEAKAMFEAVLARDRSFPSALTGYAKLLANLGESEKAEALYRKALDLGVEQVQALAGLADCRKFTGNPPELATIRALLERKELSASNSIRLCQAAAKIANDIGDYDAAFEYYRSARGLLADDAGKTNYASLYRQVRAIFTPAFFSERKGYGDASEKPVFIVGMPRSGTTLTEQIIASHPRAAGAGEIGIVRKAAISLGFGGADEHAFARRINALKFKESGQIAKQCLAEFGRFSKSAARITDKLPHNFEVLGLIALIFPNAKIVHCRRNPLDTCVSCFLSPLKEGHAYAQDLTALGNYYREYASLMEYWRTTLPIPMLEIDYEALVADTEGEARRLIDFIGLAWDPVCLDFQRNSRAVHTISAAQVREPIYRTSVERWRRYEKHLGPLRQALGDLAT